MGFYSDLELGRFNDDKNLGFHRNLAKLETPLHCLKPCFELLAIGKWHASDLGCRYIRSRNWSGRESFAPQNVGLQGAPFQFSHLRGNSRRDRIVEHDELADAIILCEMRFNRADMSDSATSEDHKDSCFDRSTRRRNFTTF